MRVFAKTAFFSLLAAGLVLPTVYFAGGKNWFKKPKVQKSPRAYYETLYASPNFLEEVYGNSYKIDSRLVNMQSLELNEDKCSASSVVWKGYDLDGFDFGYMVSRTSGQRTWRQELPSGSTMTVQSNPNVGVVFELTKDIKGPEDVDGMSREVRVTYRRFCPGNDICSLVAGVSLNNENGFVDTDFLTRKGTEQILEMVFSNMTKIDAWYNAQKDSLPITPVTLPSMQLVQQAL